MDDPQLDAIIENYFGRLEGLLSSIPRDRRDQLIDELREHVNQARSDLPVESAAGVHEILERIGSPEEIAREELGGRSSRAPLARLKGISPWTWVIVLLVALVIETSVLVPLATQSNTNTEATSSTASTGSRSSSSSASVGYDGPAICSPTTDAATSGGSPEALMQSASEVAHGTIEGKAWSLWSVKHQTGAAGLEDGGLVFDGRAFGLCPGYPNPSESEMIDTGGDAIIYGVVDYPGLATVQLGTGSINSFAIGAVLPSPHVMIVNGVSFYIGTLPKPACSYSYFEVNTTSPSYSTEHNIGFSGRGEGQGYSITNNPGNGGACVAGKLDPLSYSEGVWQLPPGQFQNNSSGGGGSGSGAGAGSVNVPDDSSTCSPTTSASSSGGPASALMSNGTEVAQGTLDGESWSLWSANGQSGAQGIEDGGLVLGGRAYGLCPGYPNPAEMQLVDAGSQGVVVGVVGYPGLARVSLSESTAGTFDVGQTLPSPTVQQVDGVSFFIGTLPESACKYSSIELNTTSPGVSAEHNLGFGTCVANQLVPITESQGVWQLPPGQFQSGL